MEETDRQYYARRGQEERNRAAKARSDNCRDIHSRLADLHEERANNSANENSRSRWRKPTAGLVD